MSYKAHLEREKVDYEFDAMRDGESDNNIPAVSIDTIIRQYQDFIARIFSIQPLDASHKKTLDKYLQNACDTLNYYLQKRDRDKNQGENDDF